MKIIIISSDNNSEINRFKIPNIFVSSPKGKKRNEIEIIPPNICPICGKTDVDKNYEIKSSSYNFRKFITILMCSRHIQVKEKTNFSKLLHFVPIFIILFMISLLFLKIITISFTSLFIFLIVPIICVSFTYNIIKGGNKLALNQKFINKYITLKVYRVYSIISIIRLDWAKEFKNLNQTSEHKLDLELIEVLKKKRKQTSIHIGITVVTCISGILISSILYNIGVIALFIIFETLFYIFYYLLIGITILFVIKIGYYTMKILDMED